MFRYSLFILFSLSNLRFSINSFEIKNTRTICINRKMIYPVIPKILIPASYNTPIFIEKKNDTFSYGSKARKKFKKTVGISEYVQDHHCIPKQWKEHPLILNINYSIHCSSNIIMMPNKKGINELNLNPNTLVHDGGHTPYNYYVKDKLDYIYYNCRNIDNQKYQFWLLIHHLKKNMIYNEENLPWK